MARTVSIGTQDFEKMIQRNCFYVDKTGFIKEWWESEDEVTLITRPRRFGKTLNMSMLNCFFSNKYADRGELFEKLEIWKDGKYREIQGTYPVIFLSFANIKQNSYKGTIIKIKKIICDEFQKYAFLKDWDGLTEVEKKHIRELDYDMSDESAQEAINDFWGYPSDESNIEAVETSIRKYAKAIVDTLNLYGYDGFDIDYEPVAGPYTGNIVNSDEHLFFFIDELGKYLGPKSGTGRLLVIDGEPQRITTKPEIGTYFDYFIIQAYKPGSDSNLDKRLIDGKIWGPGLVETFGKVMTEEEITRRTIMTENFEATDAAMDGGYPYTDRYGNSMKSLEGMARWQPRNGFRKGGVGTYHMEAEFGTSPEYKNMRRAIQIMNPSSHSLLKN